jgi:DNA helicase II / ATP-dependent DNA helicase PcrA
MQLNPLQEKAVNHTDGHCLVVAAPGSGKTRVLVERTVRLIMSGVQPRQIISLTFTNKAAKEMKERILARLSDGSGNQNLKMFVGTFHALCAKILRQYSNLAGLTPDFSIIDSSDQKQWLKKTTEQMHPSIKDDVDMDGFARAINDTRENLIDIEDAGHEPFLSCAGNNSGMAMQCHEIAVEYLSALTRGNSVDFSGLLYDVICLLKKNDRPREFMQGCHQYLQVDEAQDTNLAQFTIMELLSERHKNVFVVGDIDQSIYSWRGARYQNINDFLTKNKDCKLYHLNCNYRSTPQIMDVASKLIQHNSERLGGKCSVISGGGDPVSYKSFSLPEEEARYIATKIHMMKNSLSLSYKDFAVLYRTNFMSRILEEQFVQNNVPYRVIGGFSFYDRAEIKDCLFMLRLLANRKDSVAFYRVTSFLDGVGAKSVAIIENDAHTNQTDFIVAASNCADNLGKRCKLSIEKLVNAFNVDVSGKGAAQILMHLIKSLGYEQFLQKSKQKAKIQDRVENVLELIHSINENENRKLSVSEYLQKISLLTSNDDEADSNQVSLMTLHAAKGLEFPSVFVVGVEKDLLPHVNSIVENREEEERRLFYVGITRAEKYLHVSSCQRRPSGYGKDVQYRKCTPSVFLKQAGLIQCDKY